MPGAPGNSSALAVAAAAALLLAARPSPAADPVPDWRGTGAPAAIVVVQDGATVQPEGGLYRLERRPFVVRALPGVGRLSVHATTDTEAARDAHALRSAPLVAPLGTAAAASPLSLHVEAQGPEVHAGLSSRFLERWGPELGAAHLTEYGAMRDRLPLEPNILVSPRQYANVLRSRDGAQHLVVFRLGDAPVREWQGDALSLFVFVDHDTRAGARALWTGIDAVDVLQLRFGEGAKAVEARSSGGGEVPATDWPAPDCGEGAVVRAVRDRDWRRVERLLAQGLDPNLRLGPGGATLLMCALGGPGLHATTVWALLEGGADVHARTVRGETALLWAVRGGHGVAYSGERLGAVGQLLSRGAEPDTEDVEGETPLLAAVSRGDAEVAAMLLAAGADGRHANRAGETPVDRAVRLGQQDLAALIRLYAGEYQGAPGQARLYGRAPHLDR
jgi:hypothetical protein